MHNARTATTASLFVIATGTLWGFYWLPIRRLADMGLSGAWGTLAIVATATLLLAPFAVKARHRLARSNRLGLASLALGGASFVLYSAGLVYGRVAIVILMFYLTPVWSTLIGRYVMGWPTPRLRLAAIVVGLLGLALVLGAGGEAPVPHDLGDWLGLASGVFWAIASTGIRSKTDTGPGESASVFALGACIGAAVLAPILEPLPGVPLAALGPALGWILAAGGFWWGLSMTCLMWATARLEPARVGILLMAEVLVGASSAAVFAGERLGPIELAGGVMIVIAGVLEIWPIRSTRPAA